MTVERRQEYQFDRHGVISIDEAIIAWVLVTAIIYGLVFQN